MSEISPADRRNLRGAGPRKAERTRQAILDAALEFLRTRPFREITVAEVMARAGASRPAFYQYFHDLHDLLETLLRGLRDDIMSAAAPWLTEQGDPVLLLQRSLRALVEISHSQGPILRAVSDAAPLDARLEAAWAAFLEGFDDAVAARIEEHQARGLIPAFPARPVAAALNRMDAALLIERFGRPERGDVAEVTEAITRIWLATLYGAADPDDAWPATNIERKNP